MRVDVAYVEVNIAGTATIAVVVKVEFTILQFVVKVMFKTMLRELFTAPWPHCMLSSAAVNALYPRQNEFYNRAKY